MGLRFYESQAHFFYCLCGDELRYLKKKRAPFLLKVFVAILIVGIIIVGVFSANVVIIKFRLKTAEILTKSSLVQLKKT